jgi:regulator of protease activity HflC (stomatin/prohibitin superfamily)
MISQPIGVEAPLPETQVPDFQGGRDPYMGAVIVLLAIALVGAVAATIAGIILVNPVFVDVAVTLGLSAGVLLGVLLAQTARQKPKSRDEQGLASLLAEETEPASENRSPSDGDSAKQRSAPVRFAAGFGALEYAILLLSGFSVGVPAPVMAILAAAVCLAAWGVAATAARYFDNIPAIRFPEAPYLCRGARVVAWILLAASASVGAAWLNQNTIVLIIHFAIFTINVVVCVQLFSLMPYTENEPAEVFPLDIGVLSVLGSRANVLGSILDAGERQLGIDLSSTWAFTIVRRSMVPLLIGLGLLGWLSTSATVIGVQEQGLVERLGVSVVGPVLEPGLHLHWPWPIDQVFRIPVQRVQTQQVGHEGQEEEGPENVLWAVEHAPNEYTLVLGNGRDLITVDATVQYRIVDARAWRYNFQNPADALRAIAYRAVMKSTVNRTLSEALSENVALLTGQMRDDVQRNADALGLGIKVLAFTVGGLHPPVPVASDYEAVVSAELGKVTAVVNAQAYRNQIVPSAEASVVAGDNAAHAEGAQALALAAGEAWSFRTLESQYRAAPEEFFFRRRLETLENGLDGLHFIVVDDRFLKDGGELWLTQ